jgi:hypothetical protein
MPDADVLPSLHGFISNIFPNMNSDCETVYIENTHLDLKQYMGAMPLPHRLLKSCSDVSNISQTPTQLSEREAKREWKRPTAEEAVRIIAQR